MRSQYEPQIFSAVIKYFDVEEEFLCEISNKVIIETSLNQISWENLQIPEIIVSGMKINGFPNLKKETYKNFILSNNQPYLLTPYIKNQQVTLISKEEFVKVLDEPDYRWSIIYGLTRPGFSEDFSQALIQITAHCPAGPSQYGSLLYLERTDEQWKVNSFYGLYNQ
ncbi:hypothetical protein FNW02_28345 [Komarekiella sp. 'clone 1']|uniref:Uncharacterized protein n=1 Tax=Komarekiella delphini-convector SJRDD-AB1 TaxID=2593771 RepID=A0AA40T2N2_9NOST|nr:hypothetical protein [Komarekiella delphini-convector]MBD6619625.1 hypothetical protein [Komarekiella delphini-convector SJRDD-AB1]